MRKWVCLFCTALVLLTVASCSIPITLEPESESATEGHTLVITSHTLVGLATMPEGIDWQNSAMIALQSVGSRSAYTKQLQTLYDAYYSQTDRQAFDELQKVDLGGDEVYLVVPRFELTTMSVFTVAIDSSGKSHILKQAVETNQAFLLFCDTHENPNAEISVVLSNAGAAGNIRVLLKRDAETGELILPSSVQELK